MACCKNVKNKENTGNKAKEINIWSLSLANA